MSEQFIYQHAPQHYAKLYNVTERTIYRWIDDGLPLDDEQAIRLAKGKSEQASCMYQGMQPLSLSYS